MELEKQVCSLELAKRLKELGIKQESLWIWTLNERNDGQPARWRLELKSEADRVCGIKYIRERACAFTVAELGEMLPIGLPLPFRRDDHIYLWTSARGRHPEITEANARAAMLLDLIERGIIPSID